MKKSVASSNKVFPCLFRRDLSRDGSGGRPCASREGWRARTRGSSEAARRAKRKKKRRALFSNAFRWQSKAKRRRKAFLSVSPPPSQRPRTAAATPRTTARDVPEDTRGRGRAKSERKRVRRGGRRWGGNALLFLQEAHRCFQRRERKQKQSTPSLSLAPYSARPRFSRAREPRARSRNTSPAAYEPERGAEEEEEEKTVVCEEKSAGGEKEKVMLLERLSPLLFLLTPGQRRCKKNPMPPIPMPPLPRHVLTSEPPLLGRHQQASTSSTPRIAPRLNRATTCSSEARTPRADGRRRQRPPATAAPRRPPLLTSSSSSADMNAAARAEAISRLLLVEKSGVFVGALPWKDDDDDDEGNGERRASAAAASSSSSSSSPPPSSLTPAAMAATTDLVAGATRWQHA